VLAERHHRIAQLAMQVERRLERMRRWRQPIEHLNRALEIGDGLESPELRGEAPASRR
jgi:hypothetical protein